MRKGRFTADEREEIRKLWNEGYWYDEIGQQLDRNPDRVEDAIHNDLGYARPPYSPAVCKLARALYEKQELTVTEVAGEMDVSPHVASRMLWKAGTRMRRPGYRASYNAPRKAVRR